MCTYIFSVVVDIFYFESSSIRDLLSIDDLKNELISVLVHL